jgi:hypothetical protein
MSHRQTVQRHQAVPISPAGPKDLEQSEAWTKPDVPRLGRFGAMKIRMLRSEAFEQRVKDYCLAMQQRIESPRQQQRATELMLRWVQNDVRHAQLDASPSAKDYRSRLESILEHNYHLIESLFSPQLIESDAMRSGGEAPHRREVNSALVASRSEAPDLNQAPTVLLRRYAQGLHPLENLDTELLSQEEPISLESVGMPSDLQSLSDAVLLMKRLQADARLLEGQVSSSVGVRLIDRLKGADTSAWPSEACEQVPLLISAIEQYFKSRASAMDQPVAWQALCGLMEQLSISLKFATLKIDAFTDAHLDKPGEDRQKLLNRLSNLRHLWEGEAGLRLALATRAAGTGEHPAALGAYRGEVDDIQLLRFGREEALRDYLGVEPRWQEKLKRIVGDQFSKYLGSTSTASVSQAFERLSEVIPPHHDDAQRLKALQQSLELSQLDEAALVVNEIRIHDLEELKQSVDYFSLAPEAIIGQTDALAKHLALIESRLPEASIQAAVKSLKGLAAEPATEGFSVALHALSQALAEIRSYLPIKLEQERFSTDDMRLILERSKENHEALQQLATRWLGPHEAREIRAGMDREWYGLVSMIGSGLFGAMNVSLTIAKLAVQNPIVDSMIVATKDLLPLVTGPIGVGKGVYDLITGLRQEHRALDAKQKCRLLQQHFAQRIDGRPIDADLARIAASLKRGQAYQARAGQSKALLGGLGITSSVLVTTAAVAGVVVGTGLVVGAGVATLGTVAAVLGGIGLVLGVGVLAWKLGRWLKRRSEKNKLVDVIRRKPEAIAAYRKSSPLRSFLTDEQIALQATHLLMAKSSRFAARSLIERLRFERNAMHEDLFKESHTVQLLSVFYHDKDGNPDFTAINALLQLSADEAMASFERKLQLRLT